jgi:hypothetical protein
LILDFIAVLGDTGQRRPLVEFVHNRLPVEEFVQNHGGTKQDMTYFYIGSSPSMASNIVHEDAGTAGVMVSMTSLCNRKSDFEVSDWILDSGAFTEVARYGGYRFPVEEYALQILRWSGCGRLLAAVAQDFMCEPFVVARTGLTVSAHQALTIERYDYLLRLVHNVLIMPVLQGYRTSDYLKHLSDYGDRLTPGMWVGVGSICRRNGSPEEVADILRAVKLLRPDLNLHGFGLKLTALQNEEVRDLLFSADSMAWSYPRKFMSDPDRAAISLEEMAMDYQEKVAEAPRSSPVVPSTAGAGNNQGRKPKWQNQPTKAIRVPARFADKLLQLAKEMDDSVQNH